MGAMHDLKKAAGEALKKVRSNVDKIAIRDPKLATGTRIEFTSDAFGPGTPIPVKYTADGDDLSPPLRWSGVPANAQELVLLCEDPDAPKPTPFVHWIAYHIAPTLEGLPEGIAKSEHVTSPDLLQGRNTMLKVGYMGAAPPPGHGVHHYHFQLFALDARIEIHGTAGRDEVLRAMAGHVIARGELVGTYERR